MKWRPVTEPPIMYQYEFGVSSSKPVLVYTESKILVATLKKWDDESTTTWYSDCSEHWNLTNTVKFWMPLPKPPKE